MTKLLLIGLIVFLVDIPFGYWRANVKKFSLQWILAIHIPVLIVIALRLTSHLGFAWYTYVVLVSAFFLGQQSGAMVIKKIHRLCDHATSCMVMDLYHCARHHENVS